MATIATEDVLAGRVPRRATQVRPHAPTAFELKEGQYLQISDVSGKQVANLIAFGAADQNEYLSTAHTRQINNSLMLIQGMTIYSNRRNAMLVLLDDTVGRHDILLPADDARSYRDDYGIEEHVNTLDNFVKALAPWGIGADRIPSPVNWFMNVGLKARGELEVREPISERNDKVLLRALMDLIVAVSANPNDQNATNGFNPTDILVRVYQ